jgi:hypothetical protein
MIWLASPGGSGVGVVKPVALKAARKFAARVTLEHTRAPAQLSSELPLICVKVSVAST